VLHPDHCRPEGLLHPDQCRPEGVLHPERDTANQEVAMKRPAV
jgi:hypothetical protein